MVKKTVAIAKKSAHVVKETTGQILEKITMLATSAFGLVAALAWNDAIQALFKTYFGEQATLMAKVWYAVLVTVIVVLITVWLGALAKKKEEKSI